MIETEEQPEIGENFRLIPGYDGYGITIDGVLWSKKKRNYADKNPIWRKIRYEMTHDGYKRYPMMVNRKKSKMTAHRLVLMAFVGPQPAKMQGCHNDNNRVNNHVSNLRWDTQKNNSADMKKHGTKQYGAKNKSSKLTVEKVLEIRRLLLTGMKQRDIAKLYGVTPPLIGYIKIRKIWNHI